jgi:lipid-binding SYLF domain-containing protein
MKKSWGLYLLGLVMMVAMLGPGPAYAKAAKEIDASVDVALEHFQKNVHDGKNLLQKAKGVLVFPGMIKGGFGLGAEYGEGALRIQGKTVDYYNMISGSLGFQLGGQSRRVFILFMEPEALQKFRADPKWLGGLNASGVLIDAGGEGSMDTMKANQPIMTFVLDQKGLMYDLNLEVGRIHKIQK